MEPIRISQSGTGDDFVWTGLQDYFFHMMPETAGMQMILPMDISSNGTSNGNFCRAG